jgi:seryl-tRNA synthetase
MGGVQAETLLEAPAAPADLGSFRDALFEAGLLLPTGIDGLYGRSAAYQAIVRGIDRAITELGGDAFEPIEFPPVLSRPTFDRTDYLRSFPDLMGSVHVFQGDDRKHAELIKRYERRGAWEELVDASEVVLSSAACHPLYSLCTGRLPAGGRRFEIRNWCFRHEPSTDPARMMAFAMHELVYVGEPEEAQEHREVFLDKGLRLLGGLGLPMKAVPANDPFFGRLGTIQASIQLEEALKIEGVTPIVSEEAPTAIISGNCARDHFGAPFDITTESGAIAHSSCVAFGVDRVTLALLRHHGLEPRDWPPEVRHALWP